MNPRRGCPRTLPHDGAPRCPCVRDAGHPFKCLCEHGHVRDWRRVPKMGAHVAAAHGVPFKPFAQVEALWSHPWIQHWLVLPHPSGRSRLWNGAGSVDRARDLVLALVAAAAADGRRRGAP